MDLVQSWVESLADASPEPPPSPSDPKSCAHRRTSKISPIDTGESSLPSDANHGPTSHHGSGGDLFELTLNTRLVSPDFLLPRSTGVASSSSLGVRVRQKIRLGLPSPIFIPSHSGVPIRQLREHAFRSSFSFRSYACGKSFMSLSLFRAIIFCDFP